MADAQLRKKTTAPHVELNTFLKLMKIANTGGEAKHLIRSRNIYVDGEIETRNRRKLFGGMVITYSGKKFAVSESILR
jgi:ribosome-associated protein